MLSQIRCSVTRFVLHLHCLTVQAQLSFSFKFLLLEGNSSFSQTVAGEFSYLSLGPRNEISHLNGYFPLETKCLHQISGGRGPGRRIHHPSPGPAAPFQEVRQSNTVWNSIVLFYVILLLFARQKRILLLAGDFTTTFSRGKQQKENNQNLSLLSGPPPGFLGSVFPSGVF